MNNYKTYFRVSIETACAGRISEAKKIKAHADSLTSLNRTKDNLSVINSLMPQYGEERIESALIAMML